MTGTIVLVQNLNYFTIAGVDGKLKFSLYICVLLSAFNFSDSTFYCLTSASLLWFVFVSQKL